MARKRGKGAKPADTTTSDDRLVDVLAELLACSGVWDSHIKETENAWDSLASSLTELATKLEKLNATTQTNSSSDDGEEHYAMEADLVLSLEQAAQDVRLQGETFSAEIIDISMEFRLCQELESICSLKTYTSTRPLAKSLMGGFRRQRWAAENIVRSIPQFLSRLHNVEDPDASYADDLLADLRQASALISRRCLDRESSPWKEAIELLSHGGVDLSHSVKPSSLQTPTVEDTPKRESLATYPQTQDNDRGKLFSGSSILEVARAFADGRFPRNQNAFSLLLVGAEGSGKTHCCEEIETMVQPHVLVIRPSLPFDAMGLTVGSAEDRIIAMVTYARTSGRPTILLLDDVETICGNESHGQSISDAESGGARASGGGEPHVTARVRTVLLSLLETLHNNNNNNSLCGNDMLLICTSKVNFGKSVDRFDKVFTLTAPKAAERREVISHHATLCQQIAKGPTAADPVVEAMLSSMTDCTAGISHAELAQYCRQAVLKSCDEYEQSSARDKIDGRLHFFEALKQQVQSSTPESLRSGANADFVDMKVFSARDLRELPGVSTPDGPAALPLYGNSAEAAWNDLRRLIVMPLCQAKALNRLMFQHGGSGSKVFAGGVLITGPPGCGKSALSYYCAAVASAINPSVKLIDVSCTSLIHKEVGSSERAIHSLFESARAAAPCIVLMDGIENIAAVRGNDNTTEGTMDRVLSTLLTELDGVDSETFSLDNPACLSIIGITHNASWIDPALRRPGRLGRVIELGRPEHEARRQLVLKELQGAVYMDQDNKHTSLERLADYVAAETEGLTGAAVIAVCNEAKMRSSKEWCENSTVESTPQLSSQHVMAAIESQQACQS